MTDEEKKVQGTFYEIDEKNKRIIYDPQCNHYGKWDYDIDASAKNMSEIAKQTGYEVEATFNGTKFSVTPGMSPENGVKSYTENCARKYEEYKKSPQYAAEQALLRIEKQKEQKQIAQDDALIANEKIDFDYPNLFVSLENDTRSESGKRIFKFAERWAKLMQAEMKKQKTDLLTKKSFKIPRNVQTCLTECLVLLMVTPNESSVAHGVTGKNWHIYQAMIFTISFNYGQVHARRKLN